MPAGTELISFGVPMFRGTIRIIPDPAGIALLARTPAMSAEMGDRAEEVAENAKSIAPYGPGKDGHYRDMIRTAPIVSQAVAGARVNAWKFTSAWIEFGNPPHTPQAFACLRRGCDMAGLSLSGGDR